MFVDRRKAKSLSILGAFSEEGGGRDALEKIGNALLILYLISIYVWSGNATMHVYSNLLCLITIVVMLLVVRVRNIYISLPLGTLILFAVFCVISILWAIDPSRSTTMALRTLPLLVVFSVVLYSYLASISDGKRILLRGIYVSGICLAIYAIFTQGGPSTYLSMMGSGLRAGGEVANENTVGMGTGFSLIVAFYQVLFEKKPINIVPMLLCGLVALGTGSNKALIAMVLGCLFLLVFYAYQKKSVVSLFMSLALIVAILAGVLFLLQLPMFETINERFSSMVNTFLGISEDNASTSARMQMMEAGIAQFLERPILGIGIGNSGIITQRISQGLDTYLHNNYVELLACVGIVGTALFYAAPVSCAARILRNLNVAPPEAVLDLVIILSWLVIQVGFVAYSDKTTYVYIVLAALYAYPIGSEQASTTYSQDNASFESN